MCGMRSQTAARTADRREPPEQRPILIAPSQPPPHYLLLGRTLSVAVGRIMLSRLYLGGIYYNLLRLVGKKVRIPSPS